jgi:valyl-tRNA synthetase
MLISKSWPVSKKDRLDPKAFESLQVLIDIISSIRKLRADQNVEAGKKVTVFIHSKKNAALLETQKDHILRMAGVETLTIDAKPAKHQNAASAFLADAEVHLSLEGLFDPAKLKMSLVKEQTELSGYIKSVSGKLSNKSFTDRAPKEVVDAEKAKLAEAEGKLKKIEERLKQID